jgi:hypothetical protein
MKLRDLLALVLVLGAIGFVPDTALATRISPGLGKNMINTCKAGGGVSWVPGQTGFTTGCMNADGSGVVCGGKDSKYKDNCDTFRVRSRDVRAIRTRVGSAKP